MKRYLTILLLLNVVAMTASAREVFPINEGWRFFFKSEKTSDNARHVTLPHSWNTDPLAQGYWLETTGSYQNGMYIPVEWASKRLFVKFYGVQSVADLFVNGYHVGTHRGGATAFTFEITDKIRFGSDNSLLDVLTNDDSPMADSGLNQESLAKEVDRALRQLHEREREILKMFFGIGCQEMTLEEIGAKFDLTRERVRQIKEKAIRRLKGQKSRLLKTYLGQ